MACTLLIYLSVGQKNENNLFISYRVLKFPSLKSNNFYILSKQTFVYNSSVSMETSINYIPFTYIECNNCNELTLSGKCRVLNERI